MTRCVDATRAITVKSITESRRTGQTVDIRILEMLAFRPGKG